VNIDRLARLAEDRASLTEEEFSGLLKEAGKDPAVAPEILDQFLVDDLLSRKFLGDRADFHAQAIERVRAAATGEDFCRDTLDAVRQSRKFRWRFGAWETAAAAVLVAALFLMLYPRKVEEPPEPTPAAPAPEIGGLRGEYFQHKDLTIPLHARIDSRLDFRWEPNVGPAPGLGDIFSARWTGRILPRYSEEYTFRIRNDDGVRLWIDGRLVIDDWTQRRYIAENRGRILLEGGRAYSIQVEYYDDGNLGLLQLFWSSARQPEEIVPSSCLRPE